MDINYLLKREQASLFLAGRAASAEARIIHTELARLYGVRLNRAKFPRAGSRVTENCDAEWSENPDRGLASA